VAVHEAGPDGRTHFLIVTYYGGNEEQAAALTKGRAVRLAGRVTSWRDQEGKERLGLVASDLAAIA
jgi:hypothetical protein